MKSLLTCLLSVFFIAAKAQNVGIGTNTPQAKLHVDAGILGEVIRVSSDLSPLITFNVSGFTTSHIGVNNSVPFSPEFRIATLAGTNYPVKIYTNDNLRMTVSENGNVGVGNNTAPATTLHINSPSSEAVRVQGPTAYQTFYNSNNYMGYIQAWTDGLGIGATSGNSLRFYTNTGFQRMAILANGNVGIGNGSPGYLLDVNGDVNVNGALRTNGAAGVQGQILVSNGSAGVQWRNNSFSNNVRFCATFTSATGSINSYTTCYNMSPSDVSINPNTIIINKPGLYHIEGSSAASILLVSAPGYLSYNFSLILGTSLYQFSKAAAMNPLNSPLQYESSNIFSVELYLAAGTVISPSTFINSIGADFVNRNISGILTGYLISE